jgi:amino acid adenylation domain-containing protein
MADSYATYTYAQLDQRANSIAKHLLEIGLSKGSIVVTALHRSAESIAATLAILKAGGVYCPLDLQDPPSRHRWTLEDCSPFTILTSSDVVSRLPSTVRKRVLVDEISNINELPGALPGRERSDPACIMYTSGSTGRPKAAVVPHGGILRLILDTPWGFLSPGVRVVFHSPMHFDAATFEIWAPLLHGGCCVICDGPEVLSLGEISRSVHANRANVLFLGPSQFNLAIEEYPQLFQGLEVLLLGGEVMSVRHARKAQSLFPTMRLINGYGPTETTTFATTYTLPNPLPAQMQSVPIGTPIANTRCYLLDEHQQPVSGSNTTGELYIGGEGVALGYLNQPDLSAAKFLPDPFAGVSGARMYRTGDMCRWLPDGNLDFIGRGDTQVKIRGKRVELGETEATLNAHPDVSQCIVTVHEARGDRNLVAYVVLRSGATCSAEDIKSFLQERLPIHQVPHWVVTLERLPLRPNGKLDRTALPQPHLQASQPDEEPGSPLEATLIKLWRDVLQNQRIGPHECFFKMGGSSLDALKLCCLIEKETGLAGPVSDLYQHSTPRSFAAWLQSGSGNRSRVFRLNESTSTDRLFCISGNIANVLNLRDVALRLSDLVSAWGIAFPQPTDSNGSFDQVETIAADFIRLIRNEQSTGPYRLLGFSFGGVVAFEIARQLVRCGEEVQSLILLDAYLYTERRVKSFPQRLGVHLAHARKQGWGLLLLRLRQRFNPNLRGKPPNIPASEAARALNYTASQIERALNNYRPQPVDVNALLIRAMDRPEWLDFEVDLQRENWLRLLPRLRDHAIPGEHNNMLAPPTSLKVAQLVRQFIASAIPKTVDLDISKGLK